MSIEFNKTIKLKSQEEVMNTLAEEGLLDDVQKIETDIDIRKIDRYTWINETMENSIDLFETKAKEFKEMAEALKDKLVKFKLFVRWRLNREEDDAVLGLQGKTIPKNYKKSIVDESKLKDDEFTYTIKNLSKEQYDRLIYRIDKMDGLQGSIRSLRELSAFIQENTEKKPFGVTKLPEDHPAVLVQETYSVRFAKLNKKEAAYVATLTEKEQIGSLSDSFFDYSEKDWMDRQQDLLENNQTDSSYNEQKEADRT